MLFVIVRWIHILAAAAWLGEVATVVFVLVPAACALRGAERAGYIARVFPRVFRLATALAIATLIAGVWLNYLMTGWRQLDLFLTSPRGLPIALGGLLGLLLAGFHFGVEARLEAKVEAISDSADEAMLERVSRFLTIVPRVGLIVLVAVFLLMMIGARGV
jgi:uncharacterized membrane protein